MLARMSDSESRPAFLFTNLFVFLSGIFFALTVALLILLLRALSSETTLSQLSSDDRLRLLAEAQSIAPAVYQPFPPSGPMSFYHMKPDTSYENVLGDDFTTNDLGFRSIATFPKPKGTRRALIVGDSWTYGPYVTQAETFSGVLSNHLNTSGQRWQVYNLAMLGWNTRNQVSALRTYIGQIKPDLVVICPTSNDIDNGLMVWNGNLVNNGFDSRAIFRYSHTYESRWFEVFGMLQQTADRLAADYIPTLVYFLAEWRNLAPYYARRTGFHANYTVVPTEYISDRYRLPTSIDPGRHASAEGHRLIGEYLFNALIDNKLVFNLERIPSEKETTFPKQSFDEDKVRAELGFWSQFADRYDLVPLHGDMMGRSGLFSIPLDSESSSVRIQLNMIQDSLMYPLTVKVRVASYDGDAKKVTIYASAEAPVLSLAIPDSIRNYAFVEVEIEADRAILLAGRSFPVSMLRPDISLE